MTRSSPVDPVSFAAIGECMLELSGREGDLWRLGFAGDTFNAAFYARAVLPREQAVAYVTALGDDPFSVQMRAFFARSGIETGRIRAVPDRRPGLYAITLTDAERAFTYWRGESAARRLADDPAWLDAALSAASLLYFSGITLAILSDSGRKNLLEALERRRGAGARIAFDTNFRPALWPDRDAARMWMERAYAAADVVLPTLDDETTLFGDRDAEATAKRLQAAGVGEIVVKDGERPSLVIAEGGSALVAPARPEEVVDTTGAGDSFAGAYLAARHMGLDAKAAARLGHAVAARVIGAPGALTAIDSASLVQAAASERGT